MSLKGKKNEKIQLCIGNTCSFRRLKVSPVLNIKHDIAKKKIIKGPHSRVVYYFSLVLSMGQLFRRLKQMKKKMRWPWEGGEFIFLMQYGSIDFIPNFNKYLMVLNFR